MAGALGISSAGLTAAADSFAQRAANVATPQALPANGRENTADRQDAAPPAGDTRRSTDRNFTRDYTGIIGDKAAFEANAAVMKTAREMTGTLLDIVA